MPNDTVFLASRPGGMTNDRYHTDPDCRHLTRIQSVLEVYRDDLPPGLDLCRDCSGTVAAGRYEKDMSTYREARDMNPEELEL